MQNRIIGRQPGATLSTSLPDWIAMPRWTVALFVALLGSALALPAVAQWKWRDRNGQTQYSDMPPPPGIAEKDILLRPASAQRLTATATASISAAASAGSADPAASAGRGNGLAPKSTEPELEAKRKQAEQAEADKRKADEARIAATKADNCGRARAELRTLDSGQRIARIDQKGERRIIDDATRAEETRRAQGAVASNCQ